MGKKKNLRAACTEQRTVKKHLKLSVRRCPSCNTSSRNMWKLQAACGQISPEGVLLTDSISELDSQQAVHMSDLCKEEKLKQRGSSGPHLEEVWTSVGFVWQGAGLSASKKPESLRSCGLHLILSLALKRSLNFSDHVAPAGGGRALSLLQKLQSKEALTCKQLTNLTKS